MSTTSVLRVVALAAVTTATAFGFIRVFTPASAVVPLVVVAVLAHLAAAATRRLPGWVSVPVMMLVGAIVCIDICAWDATTLGLPTPATFEVIGTDLADVIGIVRSTAAPTTAEPGLLLVAAATLWIAGWTADRLEFGYAAPAEAIVPSATVFVIVTALAGDAHRWLPVGIYAGTVALHLLAHRQLRSISPAGAAPVPGTWRPVAGGAAAAAGAITIGLAVAATAPALQFTGVKPIRQDHSVQVTSPLLDLHDQFVNPGDEELFRVDAAPGEQHYWRLTAYDDFDGSRWRMAPTRSTVVSHALSADRATTAPAAVTTAVTATFELERLGGTFAPAAFRPVDFSARHTRSGGRSAPDIRWDAANFALIVDDQDGGVDGLGYTVRSLVPDVGKNDLRGAAGPVPDDIRRRYTELPDSVRAELEPLARDIVGSAGSPFDRALALQNHFRNGTFTYSTDIRDLGPGTAESTDAITRFLDDRTGYCVHFAGTFAALARSLDLPTRVAVGFTPGDYDEVARRWQVRGRNAHVWPEIFFAGYGWLPFEPSPGRGNADASTYTDVDGVADPNRVDADVPGVDEPAAPSTTTPDPAAATTPPTTAAPPRSTDGGEPEPSTPLGSGSGGGRTGPLTAALAALGLALVLAGPLTRRIGRARRRRAATRPALGVRLAWTDTLDAWTRLDLERSASSTERDLADRIAERITVLEGHGSSSDAHRLAHLATTAAWNADGVTAADVVEARNISDRLSHIARSHRSRGARLVGWFDPRYLGAR